MGGNDDVYRRCPCGSGAKYKFCCLEKDRAARRSVSEASLREAEDLHRRANAFIGRMHGREAIPLLERCIRLFPEVPQPHNNLAMAHFMEGEVERALEIAERIDRAVDPGNVFALGQRIHYLLLLGRRPEAEALGRRLVWLQGRDAYATQKKCEALAMLRRHAEVHATALAALPTAQDQASGFAFMGGVAAANLARYDEAVALLEDGLEDPSFGGMAERHLERLRRKQGPASLSGEWPYFHWAHWIPPRFTETLKDPGAARRFPGLVDALLATFDDEAPNEPLAGFLVHVGTPEAFDLLRRIAFGTFGSDDLRMAALDALAAAAKLPSEESHRVYLKGEWRDVRIARDAAAPSTTLTLPEALHGDMTRMLRALKAGDLNEAEAIGRRLLEQAPTYPPLLHNLATTLLRRKKSRKEAEKLLRRALAADPDYLFARAALAQMKLRAGRTDEARELLRGADRESKRLNPEGMAELMFAEADLAFHEGDMERGAEAWKVAEKLAPEHPRLQSQGADVARLVARGVALIEKYAREREERKRRRLLPADPGLADLVASRSADDLRRLGRALGLSKLSGLRKASLRSRVLDALRDVASARARLRSLPPDLREPLRRLCASGGSMAFDAFTRAFEPPREERDGPGVLARLEESGLVLVGTIGGRPSVALPSELVPLVAAELGEGVRS